jgi:hypothetical protein
MNFLVKISWSTLRYAAERRADSALCGIEPSRSIYSRKSREPVPFKIPLSFYSLKRERKPNRRFKKSNTFQ